MNGRLTPSVRPNNTRVQNILWRHRGPDDDSREKTEFSERGKLITLKRMQLCNRLNYQPGQQFFPAAGGA